METPESLSTLLSHDLILEILSRLPVKSLLRFLCVSKSWYSLFHSPSFVKLHLRNYDTNNHHTLNMILTFVQDEYCGFVPYSLHSFFQNPSAPIPIDNAAYANCDPTFIGSCNGLVSIFISLFSYGPITEYGFVFWNPAARITSSPPALRASSTFSPNFGFGYDTSTDTYKLLAVYFEDRSLQTIVKVHTMGRRDGWRQISNFPIFILGRQGHGHFVSGTVNWLGSHRKDYERDYDADDNNVVIVSLDLRTETYTQLLLPVKFTPRNHHRPLCVMRNLLCYCHYDADTHFIIWQMMEFGVEKSWTQLMKFPLENKIFLRSISPLCTSRNGDVVMLAYNGCTTVTLYYIRENRVEHFEIPHRSFCYVEDYVQSLVLPR